MTKQSNTFIFWAFILTIFMVGLLVGSFSHDWIYHPDIKHYVIKGSEE